MSYKDGFKANAGANLSLVQSAPKGDKRFERYANNPNSTTTNTSSALAGGGGAQAPVSSTFDAFQRMAAGLEGRTISDKINDPNRPTWEQYKKQNEDKLDLVGADAKKMLQYRVELDRERELKLAMGSRGGKKTTAIDSESEEDSDDASETSKDRKKRKKREKKDKKERKDKGKKEKKERKDKKRKRDRESRRGDDDEEERLKDKKSRREREEASSSGSSSRSNSQEA